MSNRSFVMDEAMKALECSREYSEIMIGKNTTKTEGVVGKMLRIMHECFEKIPNDETFATQAKIIEELRAEFIKEANSRFPQRHVYESIYCRLRLCLNGIIKDLSASE